ncbi:hypothetical protein [Glycomyces tenuis]|uniref:hypothetical protein n=1 Tax=Glycomyces tenuis TaxID=58116 RepID=UPI000403D5BC|nr:hypothetical protein [Glycomyces tenuis]
MANAKEASRAVAALLGNNPGEYSLAEVIEGTAALESTEMTENQAVRALDRLVKEGRTVVTGEGDERRWRAAAPAEADGEPEPAEEEEPEATELDAGEDTADGETAGSSDKSDEEASEDTEADSDTDEAESDGNQEEGGRPETETAADEPPATFEPLPDPDPQVLHIARTLADIGEPIGLLDLCDRAYLPTKRRLVLNALRAMAEHGLVECSNPYNPDQPGTIWTVVHGGDLMEAAARVQLHDAPDAITCPTCGQTKTIGGTSRPRKAGTGVRNDGKRTLAPGELTGMVIDWVTDPQNTGEEITVRQITKELVAAHPDKVSDNSDGAVKNALDRLCRPDHRRLKHPSKALVALVRETGPRTYRCLGI